MTNDDWSQGETEDRLHADRAQLSPGGAMLGGPSLKCVGVNLCCTAADITATLGAPMTLPADPDDNACEGPVAQGTTDRTGKCPLAMAFRT
jgi:hypothetical protein